MKNPLLTIPYVSAPENACALACYTMVAQYYFPKTTFEEIAKISNWKPGYVVWGFPFWLWLMSKGISITDYDLIDYDSWAKEGFDSLQKSLSANNFSYIKKHTSNPDSLTNDIAKCMNNKHFTYHRKKPTFEILKKAIADGDPCEVVLNSHALNKIKGFALHRVVVMDVSDKIVTFHDPQEIPRPHRHESIEHFTYSWLSAQQEPELCIYEKKNSRV